MRFWYSILLCLVLSEWLPAQRFGGNPSRQQWYQIDGQYARIIYPNGWDGKAMKISSLLNRLQQQFPDSPFRKVNILLQHRSLLSNAYVGLGPFRSEFYTTPPQDVFELGAVDWTDNLTIHEFRHVQQYGRFRKGLSKLASVLLGEEGQAVANAASIPDWFFEGDAVYNETKFTRQGRGKLPLFMSGFQALYQAGKAYTYQKTRNGSYRDYVPDYYQLGYLLVAYGRKRFGDAIWEKVTNDAAAFKPLVYPLQGALRKHMGISYQQFVQDAFQYYRQQWEKAATSSVQWLTRQQAHKLVNDQYPYPMEDGSILTIRSSNDAIPAFYRIQPDGKETKIAVRGIALSNQYSYRNQRLVFTTYHPDPRWGNREAVDLTILHLGTQQQNTILSNVRLASPDISPNGDQVIAVEQSMDGTSNLVMVHTETGQTDTLIRTNEKYYDRNNVFSSPKFKPNGKDFYVAIRRADGSMGIGSVETATRTLTQLLPFSNRLIGYLQVQGDTLLFTTSFQGRDECWALVNGQEQKGPYRLASYATGLYQGLINQQGKLVAAAFTANGYRLGVFEPLWQREVWKDELQPLLLDAVYQPVHYAFADTASRGEMQPTRYRPSTRLLNFHSWRPYYDRPEYSFTVYGENVLNTFRSELAYTYNENEGSHQLGYTGIFGGSYLQPVVGMSQYWQRQTRLTNGTPVNWNEWAAYAGLRLPLNFTRGKQFRSLVLQSLIKREYVNWTGIAKTLFANTGYTYLDTRISYAGVIQQAKQHIFPRWGQSLAVQYRHMVNRYTARQFLLTGSVYLPGLVPSHNLVITAAYQTRDTLREYAYSDNFPFSRGYQALNYPRMWKWGVNYHFPVAYPDWGFGQIVYFLRVRANAFYDLTVAKSLRTGSRFHFGSWGGELYFDTRWWNQQAVSFGVRYSHLQNNPLVGNRQGGYWEIILPVALFK